MKIAIDGPAASGKGSLSKLLGEKLNAKVLCTGKVYRVASFAIINDAQLEDVLRDYQHFWEKYNENDGIFSRENSMKTSEIASIPDVRKALFNFQRDFSNQYENVILEGRDIGTNIMPDADFKFYINVSAEERAKRRVAQAGGLYGEILNEIIKRDAQDATNMKPAADAIFIDNNASIENALNAMLSKIQAKMPRK